MGILEGGERKGGKGAVPRPHPWFKELLSREFWPGFWGPPPQCGFLLWRGWPLSSRRGLWGLRGSCRERSLGCRALTGCYQRMGSWTRPAISGDPRTWLRPARVVMAEPALAVSVTALPSASVELAPGLLFGARVKLGLVVPPGRGTPDRSLLTSLSFVHLDQLWRGVEACPDLPNLQRT